MRSRLLTGLSTAAGLDDAPERTVAVTVSLRIEGRPLRETFDVPAEPTRPIRLLPVLQQLTNEIVSRAVATTEKRLATVSCRARCNACCHQLIPITETEAHRLRDLVEDLPAPRRREVRRRFEDARQRLEASGLLASVANPAALDEAAFEALGPAYLALRVACPFLEDEVCSIYPDRPLVCREYLVTSDPAHCWTPTPETIARVPLAGELSDALSRVDETEGDPARSVRWVALTLAPEWADAHPDLRAPGDARATLTTILGHLASSSETVARDKRGKRGE